MTSIASINSSSSISSSIDVASGSRKAQLEKQLAIYTKELAEAQQAATSKESALRVQLLQQQILAIQQQIAQLSVSSSISLPASSISTSSASATQSSSSSGTTINTFA